ncbi:AraC family transcriptional regulator [Maribacter algarum]|uniref:AraC family transcriptional regulator n=1 Tax=Maribacter algarum (ex Zhang et al. 2020) TaxID=2578118 RepID=A0A5S3PMV1_9FLAO|nr:AraC family transcriptional regulator [Maribacter algarum]TMM55792.1 AraC family transcriptional regulator [Maribacter algarum]
MKKDIENIIFSRFVNQPIPFEFISIKELYKRCKESAYDLSNPHRIEFNAMILVTEGEGIHTIDFREEILSPGVILPLTKDQVHAFDKELRVKGFVISFEEIFITQNISEKNLFHFLHIYHTPSILIGKENISALNPTLQLLQNLHEDSNLVMKSEIINAVFMSLLLQIKRCSIYQHKTFESQRFKDFISFKQLITECYHESHNAKDYAQKLSVSYKYLNDICKQIGNKTAKAFLDSWLLLEAKRNISEDKYTSQEIAYKMGFNEPSNFIRFFKKFTSVTPNQFQQKLKKSTSG